ncbi:toll/interleukin-1 receptor domain-containing adapter protein [Sphaeramia orbicularis]|uniref:TIR domain-containing protein n=1 Tax=Sphaeramia orbicularis TaxID=375764 RepID=A0A673BV22_9TELE|nr:toll/interleukin-1 receptor domain-containing adapter protein [Sphaeramia orbicularis]
MHGWFQKLFKRRLTLSTHEEEARGTTVSSVQPSTSFTPSPRKAPIEPQAILNSPQRWTRKYDVLVCHSLVDSDTEEAIRLVSFLENSPRSLRCFLWHRDTCPGGAVSTELCQAVQDSHIRVLLITPHFLEDDWCKYMMHQILAEGPMSNQMIPLLQGLLFSQYPMEIKFLFYIDLSSNRDRGYALVNKTVLQYLRNLVKNGTPLDCDSNSSSGLCGECSKEEGGGTSKIQDFEKSGGDGEQNGSS